MRKPAVFLDRDGTLITERGYLNDPKNIHFYPGVFEGLRRLQDAGFKLVVITNQSGVARGYFSLKTLGRIHRRFKFLLQSKGIKLSGIYFCPHAPDAGCACRKPKPTLVKRAARQLNLDLKKSFVIGDQERDLDLALNVGATSVLVLTGGGSSLKRNQMKKAENVSRSFNGASKWIVGQIK